MLSALFLIICVGFIKIYLLRKKIEAFEQGNESYVQVKTNNYHIKPFKETNQKTRKDVVQHLQKEWKNTGITYTESFIEETWKYPDALYVMTDNKGDFIGCAGIDHKYMTYPFISHIYVKKDYRKNGYGQRLFDVVLDHAKSIGHKIVRGWCKDELVDYYVGMGCEKSKTSCLLKPLMGFNLMSKKVS